MNQSQMRFCNNDAYVFHEQLSTELQLLICDVKTLHTLHGRIKHVTMMMTKITMMVPMITMMTIVTMIMMTMINMMMTTTITMMAQHTHNMTPTYLQHEPI